MHFHPFVVIPFVLYFVGFITTAGAASVPPGCELNTEREYGFGYERIGREMTSNSVPCKPSPSLPKSAIAPRARITNGSLTIIKPIFRINPYNDMDGLEEAEPNKPVRMAFTEDGRLLDVSRSVVYSASPVDDEGLFAYCEPDGYIAYNGDKDFWGCTREVGQENAKEKLFISTYERGIEACKRYRMRMLPCEEDSEDYVEDDVDGVGG